MRILGREELNNKNVQIHFSALLSQSFNTDFITFIFYCIGFWSLLFMLKALLHIPKLT